MVSIAGVPTAREASVSRLPSNFVLLEVEMPRANGSVCTNGFLRYPGETPHYNEMFGKERFERCDPGSLGDL